MAESGKYLYMVNRDRTPVTLIRLGGFYCGDLCGERGMDRQPLPERYPVRVRAVHGLRRRLRSGSHGNHAEGAGTLGPEIRREELIQTFRKE